MASILRLPTGRAIGRLLRLAPVAILALAACDVGGRPSESQTYVPPPPLAMVAIVDPSSGSVADQIHQIEGLVEASATPGESVVVMLPQARVAGTYVVRGGDSLSSIAAANGLALPALEAANPQFGPLSGRSWWLIHPGERVTLPDRGAIDPLLLVARAPAGPPPPTLVRLPVAPSNPTDFQQAEYAHKLAAARATNDSRVAAWRAQADQALAPWQKKVVAELESKMPAISQTDSTAGHPVTGSITAGATTLQGIQGRRLLVLLGGGEGGPSQLAPRSLVDVNLVIANLPDSSSAAAWTAAGTAAGATSVKVLDRALTQLQLGQLVNQ